MDNWENKFRGCLIGGAVGDALGYAVEFMNEASIFSEYGKHGITEYKLTNGIAHISDDTQMTMFTAAGLIDGTASGNYTDSISCGYLGWYRTQTGGAVTSDDNTRIGKLLRIPELYSKRAPGVTCMSALGSGKTGTIENLINNSKGCGGVMRVAPIGLMFANGSFPDVTQNEIDMLGAKAAAVTHGHELGYIPAAALVHIINFLVRHDRYTIVDAAAESVLAMRKLFGDTENVKLFHKLMEKSVELAENGTDDLTAIHQLGEGWVAEETLAIAVYCAVKYKNDFEKAICTAVNHNGDSDSTGAVCGNILGTFLGYDKIPQKFKDNLELHDTLLELADELAICSPWEVNLMIKTLLIQLRSNIFAEDKLSALSSIEKISSSLDTIKSEPVIYDYLSFCVAEIKSFVEEEKFSQAYALTDCIHVIPDIISALEKDWKAFWEIYVEEYMRKHNDNSLIQFKEKILALEAADDPKR